MVLAAGVAASMALATSTHGDEPIKVGVLHPLSGTMAISGLAGPTARMEDAEVRRHLTV